MSKLPAGQTFEDLPIERLFAYAGVDAIVTLDVLKKMWPKLVATPDYTLHYGSGLKKRIKAPSVLSELVNVKARALQFVVNMEVDGLLYDVDGNHQMGILMREELAQLEDSIFTSVGRRFNLASGPEVANILYNVHGLECPKRTKGGESSVDSDTLDMLVDRYDLPWLKDINRRKNVASVYNSFISTYIQDFLKRDGRIHPEYNLHGTSSHRISSSNPNLLNLPRPDSCAPYDIRSLYIAPPNHVFLTLDFSSCEVKVLAARCKDPAMLRAIREGKDFHTYTASLINGLTYEEMHHVLESTKDQLKADASLAATFKRYKKLRQAAKSVTFGILYGSSVAAIADLLDITKDEAQALVDSYFTIYPGIRDFVNNCHKMAVENLFVFSPFGQRKMEYGTLPMYKKTAAYNAALRNSQNVSIQGPASTLGLMAFAKVDEELRRRGWGGVVCTVYDSIECYIHKDYIAEAIDLCFYCMDDWPVETFDWLDFPIGTDAEIGYDWGASLSKVYRGISQRECEALLAT